MLSVWRAMYSSAMAIVESAEIYGEKR